MPYSAQQIISLSCAMAKCPSYLVQGGQFLNMVLSELCTSYELDVARGSTYFAFNTSVTQNTQTGIPPSSGPYTLPTDWLHADRNDVFYTIQGVKYVMIPQSLAEFNAQVQQPGLNAYPENYAVDNGPISTGGAPLMYVWPPAGGSYPVSAIYYRQMPDIATPETSATIPWFPNQTYLIQRLTGQLMLLTGDDRAMAFLGGQDNSGFMGAAALLEKYLKLKDDDQVVKTVTLDRRLFTPNWTKLKNTKTIGWAFTIGWLCASLLPVASQGVNTWLSFMV